MSKQNQPTPEEVTAVISEQPDLYEPTVQPLDAIQQNGYYPIPLDEDNSQVVTPSLAKLATPKSDRTWMERLKVSAKNAVSNIMNEQLMHNVAMGNALVTVSKDKEQVEYGRRMAAEAKRHLDEIMDDTEQLTPEEAESWATAIGSGSVSMVDFAANLALLRGLGAGKVGAEIGAGVLAGIAGYEEGSTGDIEKYIAETGDTELKNYKGDKKALGVNVVSGVIQGGIEALTSGLGRYIINNPLSKKILGATGQDAIRKIMGSAVGRSLAAGANESVNNAFEEWTQQLTGNIAEIVKGNKEFTMDNILNGAGQAAGVGALLGWMATPVMQEYGRRKTRDWVSDKLRKAADEKGIEISDAEIKKAANDLVGVIESKGVQQVTDNYEKINQITGAESDLAQTLAKAFESLVNQGAVKFRGATEDEIKQAGLDWANWMQAQAILDSLDKEVPLTNDPLFNAVAELDRLYLEGRNAGEGDLVPLDINNAQVRDLAAQIDDYINESRQSREQAEIARIEALREAELNARLDAVKELEQNAIAELEKARLEQNEEAIANLTLDLNMLTARVDSLTSELQGLITNRQQNTGRISIKQAKGLESPRKMPKKLPTRKEVADRFNKEIVQADTFTTDEGTFTNYKIVGDDRKMPAFTVFESPDGFIVRNAYVPESMQKGGIATNFYMEMNERSLEKTGNPLRSTQPRTLNSGEQVFELSEAGKKLWDSLVGKGLASKLSDGTYEFNRRVKEKGLLFQELPPQLQEQFRLAEENARMDEMYPEYTGDTIVVDGKERTVYNSEGQRINKSAEALTNFWRWFGDSKVVDEQGRPLVLYHGTKSEERFDTFAANATWGTPDRTYANVYRVVGTDLYTIYFKTENPAYLGDINAEASSTNIAALAESVGATKEEIYNLIENTFGLEVDEFTPIYDITNTKEFENLARTNGFDGFQAIEHGDNGDVDTFAVFEPNQIKSVDNIGTYSEDTGNILYQASSSNMLVATHAIRKEGMQRVLDTGGFAMPSLAITKTLDDNNYGEILFVAPASMAQPSRTTKVYDRDAWTPSINFIEYSAKEGFFDRVKEILIQGGVDPNTTSTFVSNIEQEAGTWPENNIMAKQLFGLYKGMAKEDVPYIQREFDKDADLRKEYLKWYDEFIVPSLEGRIFRGFTPKRGDRSYAPATLDNIMKGLKKQPEHRDFSYVDFYNYNDVVRELVTRFKSAEDIKKEQDRLQDTNAVYEADQDLFYEYMDVAHDLKKEGPYPEYALAAAILDTEGSLAERLEKYDLKNDAQSVKDVEKLVEKIKKAPVRYFESKPQRAVRFDEFKAVFVPALQEYDEIAWRLGEQGARVIRYDSSAQRDDLFNQLVSEEKDIQFQNKKTSKSTTGRAQEPRGAFDPLTRAIIFSKVSDVTTLFHESAHYWFDRNLRYYKTGMASPEWKDRWEKVMEELGVVPNARGYVTAASVKAGSEKFARSMEAYLKTGEYENAAMQWAYQDYKNMVGRVYRSLWKNYWGLEDLSPAVKEWFNMNGFDVANPMTAFTEKTTMDTAEEDIGNIVATDETKPDVPPVVQEEADAANGQVVENRNGEVAIVPEDQYETDKRAHSKLPESAEKATGVEMEPIMFNRRSMSDSLRAARELVDKDPVRAWEALKAGDDMIDGLYAGDIYRALISKYKEENNPTMIKTVVQSFANAARRAGRSVKAFDLETPTISFEDTISSLNKVFATKSNDAKVNELVKQIKNFLHEPDALNKGWEKFKKELECK